MTRQKIPHSQWAAFCGLFSLEHQGQPATVTLDKRLDGEKTLTSTAALINVTVNKAGSETSIEIIVRPKGIGKISFKVAAPSALRALLPRKGDCARIEIDSANRNSTLAVAFD